MVRNYSDFIESLNEGTESSASAIYWGRQLDELISEDWYNISVEKMSRSYDNNRLYMIKFNAGEGKYNYYGVIIDNNNTILMDKPENIKRFEEKFKGEFWKNAHEYVKNMKFDPKCLGDVSHVRDADKYNL